jgi:thiamine-phosphate pyrophosphorylase
MAGVEDFLRVMVITEARGRRTHEVVARAALKAGCKAIQLRDKTISDRDFCELATRLLEECKEADALLLINDRVDVASAVNAHGVHLGFDDIDVLSARWILGPGSVIGYSPETMEDARRAVDSGADYLGVGPVFETSTKKDAGRAIGTHLLEDYCRVFEVPVVAVGGVHPGNAREVFAAGATGAAAVTAVTRAADVEAATKAMMEAAGR